MKFRRKADTTPATADGSAEDATGGPAAGTGPFDVSQVEGDGIDRADLGSVLVPAIADRELRLQVDEQSGQVRAVMLAGSDGACEFQAFAAPRNGDLWSEVRPQIAADMERRGGQATERDGRWGTELVCQMPVKRPDGTTATQPSRVIGINGERWMLRASFLGRPAVDPDSAPTGRTRSPRSSYAGATRRCPWASRCRSRCRTTPAGSGDPMAEKSRLRQALSRWADSSEAHQRELRQSHATEEAIAIADAPEREHVVVNGVLRTVTLRPRGGVPALEAELDDGSGVITVVWLGRRRITGVDPGRSVTVAGCIGRQSGVPIMFNPRYELRP